MTALLVATPGGHLAELHALAPRFIGVSEDRVWITADTAQTRSMLEGERVHWMPEIDPRDYRGVARAMRAAPGLLRRLDVNAAISTGSGIALAFLPVASAMGREAHYIEAATRVHAPSMTGRLLQRTPGVRLYTQHREAQNGRWHYRGSVFDGYAAAARPEPIDEITTAVVTVGTMTDYFFPRLLESVHALLGPEVEVIWQTGATSVGDLPIEARPWLPAAELQDAMARADVVIGHCGVGTLTMAMAAGAYPVLVPREQRFGENVDDHQLELAELLTDRDLAVVKRLGELNHEHLLLGANRMLVPVAEPPPFEVMRR